MIDLYTAATPNGHKISIALEEMGLEYTVKLLSLTKGDQKEPWFLEINPNGRIPAIVDRDSGTSVFESGAILIHLAEKTGRFLPASGPGRAKVLEWLMWQMSAVGPILGQLNHFANQAEEKVPYAIERFAAESARLIKVMDDRLADVAHLAGDDYSIADVATYPWISVAFPLVRAIKSDVVGEGANVARWIAAIAERPAVARGMAVPKV